MEFYGNYTINIQYFIFEICQLDKIVYYPSCTCPRLQLYVWTQDKLLHSVSEQSVPTYHHGLQSLARQNTVIALHLIFLNPANSNVELLSARAAQLKKQDYLLATSGSSTCKQQREKWSWLTAADNDTAIFIFVFGKGQLSHSTTNHSQLLLSKHCQCDS